MFFKIVTNCKAFKMTREKKDLCPKIARWTFLLSEFNYTTEHCKGTIVCHVDALSYHPICMTDQDAFILKIIQDQATDDHIEVIKQIVQTQPYNDYFLKDDVSYKLYHGVDLLVISDDMQLNVIKHISEHIHFSHKHCEFAIKELFFIPNLSAKIDNVLTN